MCPTYSESTCWSYFKLTRSRLRVKAYKCIPVFEMLNISWIESTNQSVRIDN